ncbi:MAG: cytochrome c [Proteobacteria bacterium]|nr:cytochrome c [Pseudomonadota bacterium]
MSTLTKIGIGLGAVVALGLIGLASLVGYSVATWPGQYPDTPRPQLASTDDPETIARGAYIVDALAHCTICHTPEEEFLFKDVRGMVPKGGHEWQMGPMGTVYSANLTPAGIGEMSDADLARVIRTGINADHHPAPLMVAVGPMADEDLIAVMSYLRSLEPVDNDVPDSTFTAMGKTLMPLAMPGFIQPRDIAPPAFVKEGGISIERGRYIAHGPAFCFACHSEMQISPELAVKEPYFAGAAAPDPDPKDSTMELRAPNLTTHETGWLHGVTEDAFVTRLKAGRAVEHSPMPWENYALMTEDDMRSVYRYLASVPPVDQVTGPGYRKAGWTPTD